MAETGTEPPSRGLFLPNGKPIISTPSSEQIAVVNAHPKAEYFSTLGVSPEVVTNWATKIRLPYTPGFLNPLKHESFYLRKYIADPLWEKLDSEFGLEPENLAIRGTAVAIDHPVKTKTRGEVRTLSQILEEGSDTGSDKTKLANLSKTAPPGSRITYSRDHSELYLTTWAGLFREDVEREGDDKLIYPALLVYDTRNMKVNGSEVSLPEDPKLRKEAIVKAYVLDQLHEGNTKKYS